MRRAFVLLLLTAASAAAGPLEDARALMEQGKSAEAAAILEKAAAADEKDVEALKLLLQARVELKQWEEYADALVRLGKRGLAFDTSPELSKPVAEQLGLLNWYATDPQRIAVFSRLAKEFPQSSSRIGWLCVCLSAHARSKHDDEVAAVEKEIFSQSLDIAQTFRVGRAYVEASIRMDKAAELIARALDLRGAQPLPEGPLEREMAVTEMSVWRAYLAFAWSETGKTGKGNRFQEAEPETSSFEDATDAAGLGRTDGARIAVGDFDGDGWDDLSVQGQVWRNNKGTFQSLPEGTGPSGRGTGSLWGDADNDGDLDLWIFSQDKAVRLWLNDGGKFTEAQETGMEGALEAGPEGNGLGDVNGDGLLDVYLAVYEGGDMGGGRVDRLFLSKKKGSWADALEAAGMGVEKATPLCGRGVNFGDFDDDGDLDIYVSNYRLQKNYLWRNDGKGAFQDAAAELGVQGVGAPAEETVYFGHTIGSCWADLDNDLDLDLVCANLAHPRFIAFSNKTQVFMNQGAGQGWKFCDIFPWSGIPYEETHSDVSACDYDNDGDLDLYFTSVYRERPSWLVRNDGRAHFESVSWKSGTVVFNGWGHAWLDFDNDGDMDLVVCAGGKVRLFRNLLKDGSSWLQVALKGKTCNATGIGARVTVYLGDLRQVREIQSGRGTTSQDSMRAQFGFGRRAGPATVVVHWPGGKIQRVEGAELNRLVVIEEETK